MVHKKYILDRAFVTPLMLSVNGVATDKEFNDLFIDYAYKEGDSQVVGYSVLHSLELENGFLTDGKGVYVGAADKEGIIRILKVKNPIMQYSDRKETTAVFYDVIKQTSENINNLFKFLPEMGYKKEKFTDNEIRYHILFNDEDFQSSNTKVFVFEEIGDNKHLLYLHKSSIIKEDGITKSTFHCEETGGTVTTNIRT